MPELKLNSQTDLYSEAVRQFTICNSCRYCEGYCAVFPAIESKNSYDNSYIDYVANLCHDCRNCYYACPYTSPHEFSINIPLLLSSIRIKNYVKYTYPEKVSRSFFEKPITSGIVVTILSIIVTWIFALLIENPSRIFQKYTYSGSFYVILPYWITIALGFTLLGYVITIMGISSFKYWRTIRNPNSSVSLSAFTKALWDSISHKYFKGGDAGCDYPDMFSGYRRLYAHFSLFLGFILTALSTISAAIYQNVLSLFPPYPYLSLPVIFGTLGGILIIISTSTLTYHKRKGGRENLVERKMIKLDVFLLALLALISITGIAVLILRNTEYMGAILITHVGITISFFALAPYSKLIHIPYRILSLTRYRIERSRKQSIL